MDNRIKVVLLGTGRMGEGIGRLLLEKDGIQLAGAVGKRKERVGIDLGRLFNLDRDLNLKLSDNLSNLLQAVRPDVVIQTTGSRMNEVYPDIMTALEYDANVISIAEEMSYPWFSSPEKAGEIHSHALNKGVSVLGTGINPGFVLDYLIIALTGVCLSVESITASRVNDLSPYGYSVLKTQGVGLTPAEFEQGLADGTVAGHFGFNESISLIARSLGWKIDRIEQTRKPILSTVRRVTPVMTVEPGQTAGLEHIGVGYRDGKPIITLIHPQQVYPHLGGVETGDSISIKGRPDINFSSSPEIPGGLGTIALAVNMIPHVLSAKPGLLTMADLPVPAALMGDVRSVLAERFGRSQ
ncbi:MAG: 2,4-diaminopentanoate dehydrogenase [Spirochaetota bacterium]